MATYTIASQEGSDRYQNEVGAEVELDLDKNQERALLAAGWLEAVKEKK